LRHMKFPFIVIYKDPQKNWDEIVKDHLIEEIKNDGFDKFIILDWEKATSYLGIKDPKTKKKKKGKKV
jgi:hypothetical protein